MAKAREWVPLRGESSAMCSRRSDRARVPLEARRRARLATDGVRPVFGGWPAPNQAPVAIAGRILDDQGRDSDDALVLVARYRGGSPTNAA